MLVARWQASFSTFTPSAGDSFFVPGLILGKPGVVRVSAIQGGKALVRLDGDTIGHGVWIPIPSFGQFLDDMRGRLSGNSAIPPGPYFYLGKGDDGIVFRSADGRVIKASTTIPRRPFHDDHRTPGEAFDALKRQSKAMHKLAGFGVPVVPHEFVTHDGRGYLLMTYLTIPSTFTPAQLDVIEAAYKTMHEHGWALKDRPQVGLDSDGKVLLFDTGKASPNASDSEIEHDLKELKRLRDSNPLPDDQNPPAFTEHWPAGAPDGKGGQFMPSSEGYLPEHHEAIAHVASHLEAAEISPKLKERYAQAVRLAVRGMTPRAATLFRENLAGVHFYPGIEPMRLGLIEKTGIGYDPTRPPGGAFEHRDGFLFLDGALEGDKRLAGLDPAQARLHIYAHEFSHVIDRFHNFSRAPAWQEAYAEEINRFDAPLSRQATKNTQEAFAEFGRLLFTDPAKAARFPKCLAFWKAHGLA